MIFETLRNAKQLFFNNQKSGLNAANVQDAIDAIGNVYLFTGSGKPHSEVNTKNNMQVQVFRAGNVVTVSLDCTMQNSPTVNEISETLEECVLPEGFRPPSNQFESCVGMVSTVMIDGFTRWRLDDTGQWHLITNIGTVYCERHCGFSYITVEALPDESYLYTA